MPDFAALDDEPRTPPPTSSGRFVLIAALLVGMAGCGDNAAEKIKAYEDARAAVERERGVLRSMRNERERLYGEYLMHDFESRVWAGRFAPSQALGIDLSADTGNENRLARFFYRRWPLGWTGQLDRLLARSPRSLPWFDRYAGEAYERKLRDRYNRLLYDLKDRLALQQDRVRNAEEYAEILKPPGVE